MTDEIEITTKAKFLCNLCDCVSIGNKGDLIVQAVFTRFSYANCYASRLATKKAVTGTVQIKGDNKKNRFVINMFVQFYPGAPKYPNDNITKRLEWFGACLDKLLDIPEAESFAFPIELGTYEGADYAPRYTNLIDDFRKKYYLRHNKLVKIVDYHDDNFFSEATQEEAAVQYDKPIEVLDTGYSVDLDQMDLLEDDEQVLPRIKVVRKIDLKQLNYICDQSLSSSPSPSVDMQSKIKVGLKKADPIPVKTHKIPVAIKPTTPVSIVSESTMPKLGRNMLADDTDDDEKTQKKKTVIKKTVIKKTVVKKKPLEKIPEQAVTEVIPIEPAPNDQKTETVIPMPMRVYDKNPSWTKTISELASELDESWDPVFKDPLILAELSKVDKAFAKEMEAFGDHIEILPMPQNLILDAFHKCPFPPKAIVILQDPYPSTLIEAMGLALSVPDGVKIPPSLINVFTELSTDITGFVAPQSGNLTKWATEGVLLLNTALTIRYKQKESHMKLWQDFTDTLVKLISQKSDTPIVFMLWGNYAKGCKKNISNINKHLILGATHPSPLGSNQGGWFGCKHFSKCNDFLIKNKMEPIDWKLT